MARVGWGVMLFVLLSSLGMPYAVSGSGANDSQTAEEIVRLTNRARAQAGLAPFQALKPLVVAAEQHSSEMLQLGYFSHRSPSAGQEKLLDRIRTAGGIDLSVAENIYQCKGLAADQVADAAVRGLMRSLSHRKNILSSKYNRIGVGVFSDGRTYLVTQVFSYQAVSLESYEANPGRGAVDVAMGCRVVDGPREGAVFLDGQKVAPWNAGQNGTFRVSFQAPRDGLVQVGQTTAPHRYVIEAEFPLRR